MTGRTERLTTGQALVRFLASQYVERDEIERRFIMGCWGIFGHGNVAGIGQALDQHRDLLRFYQARNEQAMVHAAAAYARQRNRLQTFACTSSIGPGATNMVTAAADATINRIPVLLLPGDIFATRRQRPVLQQLEQPSSQDVSVNDAFRPVSRYWDRLNRPEQLIEAGPAAMQVLTDPADTGAVTLSLPQDVQAEAHDFPVQLFDKRVWHIARIRPDEASLRRASALLRQADRPLIVAGGGVHYSEAADALRTLVDATGIPVVETQAGKGSLPWDHPSCLGAAGVSGTPAAVATQREADVVLGVGTRWTDFTTASNTAFQHPDVRFISVNVAGPDAIKMSGVAVQGDARATLDLLRDALADHHVGDGYHRTVIERADAWRQQVDRIHADGDGPGPTQGQIIRAVNDAAGTGDTVVCASGSMPGQLHRLWRPTHSKGYHVEYGYSCMGYEIAGGLGVALADPDHEVYVMCGDGAWLMMSSEIVTAIQENAKITVILVDNHGYGSIGSLSRRIGSDGFGTCYHRRDEDGSFTDEPLPTDLATSAEALGAIVVRASTIDDLRDGLDRARRATDTTVIHIEADATAEPPGADAWWEVPIAEVSDQDAVTAARASEADARSKVRRHL